MSQYTQYLKDSFKTGLSEFVSTRLGRLMTGMQSILLQLRLKRLLPEEIIALELFGMHGLWHTRDYVKIVRELDLFELDKQYHELSKKVFRGYPVNYFNEDSLRFISTTEKKYNFVVADIPASGNFYAPNGLPLFWNDLQRILSAKSILIFNIHSTRLAGFKDVEKWIREHSGTREVVDIFFVPRNPAISYVVVAYR